MSPRKSFHVVDKISCRQKLTHVRAKMISCWQNAFHVAKTFSCRQKYFSCRQKLNFMSPNLFHVTEKVDFSDENNKKSLFVCLFVGIKPEKQHSASLFWREVKPLGMIIHGLRHFYVRETKTAAQTMYLSIYG